MKKYKFYKDQSGISIMEISVAMAIICFVLVGFMSLTAMSIKSSHSASLGRQAVLHAQEILEAAHSFRDNTSWDTDGVGTLAKGVNLYPTVVNGANGLKWSFLAGQETVGAFTRSLVISPVSRDAGGNIQSIYNIANKDDGTVKLTATVSWGAKSVVLNSYLTNWR
jgi:Tfp pilus assembly protein PilV